MYEMYPDRWADVEASESLRQRPDPAERPRRRVRRSQEDRRPAIIRAREESRSADR